MGDRYRSKQRWRAVRWRGSTGACPRKSWTQRRASQTQQTAFSKTAPGQRAAGPCSRYLTAGHVIVQGIRPPGWLFVRYVAHDRNDPLHDITADASCSTSQQIRNRSADLCFVVVPVYKLPLYLI